MQNLLEKIRQRKAKMSKAERKVADIVLKSPHKAIHFSTATISGKAKVSEPTVIRFCHALGCEGYREFKLQLAQDLVQVDAAERSELEVADDVQLYTDKIVDQAKLGLSSFRKNVDYNAIEQAVDVMLKARRLNFFGLGASATVVVDAAHKFLKLNVPVATYTDEWSQRMGITTLSESDVVVIVSYTGRTINIVNSARLAKESGVKILGITKSGSPLAEHCDICIDVDSPEEKTILPRYSRLVHFIIMEILAAGFALRKGPEFMKHLHSVQRSLEETRVPRK